MGEIINDKLMLKEDYLLATSVKPVFTFLSAPNTIGVMRPFSVATATETSTVLCLEQETCLYSPIPIA